MPHIHTTATIFIQPSVCVCIFDCECVERDGDTARKRWCASHTHTLACIHSPLRKITKHSSRSCATKHRVKFVTSNELVINFGSIWRSAAQFECISIFHLVYSRRCDARPCRMPIFPIFLVFDHFSSVICAAFVSIYSVISERNKSYVCVRVCARARETRKKKRRKEDRREGACVT